MYEMADAWGCINTYLPQHVTRKRILDFQGETWKDKQETERPNKNYKRAPGWTNANVQYQIRGYSRIGCLHERRSYSRVHTTPGSNVDTPIAGDTTRSRMASEVLSLGPERHL